MNETTNILIVDDEEVVRMSHLRILAGLYSYMEAARNGQEALRAMERRPFDLILLDLSMPDLNGISVLKVIKNKWPESQVVIITGYPSIETAKESIRLGAYDYLAKPVAPNDVINVANAAIVQKKWTLHAFRADHNNSGNLKYQNNLPR